MKESVKAFLQENLAEFQSRNRDERDAVLGDAWRDGYETAAGVCLGVLAKNIDDLLNRLGNLSKDEQVVLSRLHQLQQATKEELGAPWSTPPIARRHEHPSKRTT